MSVIFPIAILPAYVILILVSGKADNYAGPVMAVVATLSLVLAVGVTERFLKRGPRSER